MSTIAQNIKLYRQKRKLTQKELAEKAGIDLFTLSKIETGATANPSIETLRRIADVVEIKVDDLLTH